MIRGLAALGVVVCSVVLVGACSSSTSSSATSPTTAPASRAAGASCAAGGSGTGAQGSGDVLVPGDIPDNQAYVTYHSPGGEFRIDHPEGWAQSGAGSSVAFSDKFNSIRVDVVGAAAAPSVGAAPKSDVPAISASAHCFQPGRISQLSRTAGPAVLITYVADSNPDPVTGKVVRQDVERYEFWQAGKQANITLASPVKSDNVDPWRKVTDSFAWGP